MEGFIISEFTSEVGSTIFFFYIISVSQTWVAPTEVMEPILLPLKNSFSHTSLRIGQPVSTSSPLIMAHSFIPSKLSQSAIMVTNSS